MAEVSVLGMAVLDVGETVVGREGRRPVACSCWMWARGEAGLRSLEDSLLPALALALAGFWAGMATLVVALVVVLETLVACESVDGGRT